ncbi:hypothetical protein BH23BAC4_BH23BAC4_11100 [soil metagenome]
MGEGVTLALQIRVVEPAGNGSPNIRTAVGIGSGAYLSKLLCPGYFSPFSLLR